MAQYTERNSMLRELCITQNEIDQLKRLDPDEAKWRIDHEEKMHLKWAKDRAAFIRDEVLSSKLKKAPSKPEQRVPTGEPGIVSHAIGRPGSSNQRYGERFG